MTRRAGLLGLLTVGLGLRLAQLNAPLWYDEAFSAWLAGLPVGSLVDAALGDVHPPTYYLLLKLITTLAGSHAEWILRLPSLLAGVALIGAVFAIANKLGFSELEQLLAVGLTALAPFQIYYSNEARSYELVTLAVALTALALLSERPRWAVIASVSAVYLHYTAILFVGPLWLVAGRRWRRAGLVGLLLSAPALALAALTTGALGAGYWIAPVHNPGRLLQLLDDLVWLTPGNPYLFATALGTGAGVCLLLYDWRRVNRLAASAVGLPLLILAAVSYAWQPLLISRALAAAAPFYYLLLGQMVARSPRRLAVFGLLAGPVWLLLVGGLLAGDLGRDKPDTALRAELAEYDALYHANVGSYVVWHYYLPDTPQYVLPQATGLAESLTAETRTAMGMHEADFDFIRCTSLADGRGGVKPLRRWGLLYFHNPTTSIEEIQAVAELHQRYHGHKIRQLRHDLTTEAWLTEINSECNEYARLLPDRN